MLSNFDHVSSATFTNVSSYTYNPHFIPEGIAEASQILFRDTYVLTKLLSCKEYLFVGLIAFAPEVNCNQTAMGLPPATSAVIPIAK
jgi:hypothetical protein